MSRYVKPKSTALDAVVGADFSEAIRVTDFQHIVFSYSGITASNQLTKLQGAIGSVAPTFSSAKILDNEWDYVDSIDLQTGTAIDGDTGVTQSGVDVQQFSANVDGLDWISFHNVSGTTGTVTVKVAAYSNA